MTFFIICNSLMVGFVCLLWLLESLNFFSHNELLLEILQEGILYVGSGSGEEYECYW